MHHQVGPRFADASATVTLFPIGQVGPDTAVAPRPPRWDENVLPAELVLSSSRERMTTRALGVDLRNWMSLSSLMSRFSLGALVVLAGCARASHPTTAPTAASTAPRVVGPVPGVLTSNVLRDRRADSGVRAAPKHLVLGKPSSVKCGTLARSPEDADHEDLLGGRLRVRPPVGSKSPPPLPDAPSIEEESRVIAEASKLSLAIVARETFQLDPDLYEPESTAPTKPASLDVEAPKFLKATFPSEEPLDVVPVEIGTGPTKMRAYAARPPNPNAPPGKDTALVLALLVAQEDGTLQSVGFYVRGESVRNATGSDLVGCTRLAERVASTLAPGPRKLERAAGRRRVAEVSKDEELSLTVPADYVGVPAPAGARFYKLRPLSLYAGSINISLAEGGDAAIPEGADAQAVAGKLLGRPTEWRGKTTPKGGFLFAREPLDPKDPRKTVSVLVKVARQTSMLDEMRAVAETLALATR